MFKFSIAVAIGLSAATAAAHADTIIIQGTPSFDPAIISHGPIAPFPIASASGVTILDNPAFGAMSEMCDTLGFACGAADTAGIHPERSPEHRADAEKRLAQMIEDREAYVAAIADHFETLRAPLYPRPHMLFGWNAPRSGPHALPRALPRQFGNLFPSIPHTTLPRQLAPQIEGFPGFSHRLNNPGAVIPRGVFPRHVLPRYALPRDVLPRHGFPRHGFGGPAFPWPSL